MPGTGYLVPKAPDLEQIRTSPLRWINTRAKDVAEAKETSLPASVATSFTSWSRKS